MDDPRSLAAEFRGYAAQFRAISSPDDDEAKRLVLSTAETAAQALWRANKAGLLEPLQIDLTEWELSSDIRHVQRWSALWFSFGHIAARVMPDRVLANFGGAVAANSIRPGDPPGGASRGDAAFVYAGRWREQAADSARLCEVLAGIVDKSAAKSATLIDQTPDSDSRLLSLFTGGLADERIKQASGIFNRSDLSTNDKLRAIENVIPIPPSTSAEAIGKAIGVTKQAVMKTDWWKQNRQGEGRSRVEDRRRTLQEKGSRTRSDTNGSDDR